MARSEDNSDLEEIDIAVDTGRPRSTSWPVCGIRLRT